jgi:uncharacterized membrane protein YidH (DUF202 family)
MDNTLVMIKAIQNIGNNVDYVISLIYKDPFLLTIFFLLLIALLGFMYLGYINRQDENDLNGKEKTFVQVANVIIQKVTIFVIVVLVICCIFLVYFEKKNTNLLRDLQLASMSSPKQQNAMVEKYKQELKKSFMEFIQKKEVHLLLIYVIYKRIFLYIFKFLLSFELLTLEDRYFFIIEAFVMFFLAGYFEYNYENSQEIQIVLIILNVINIVIGCYRLVSTTKLQFNNLYLTENILFLYIIISILIKK